MNRKDNGIYRGRRKCKKAFWAKIGTAASAFSPKTIATKSIFAFAYASKIAIYIHTGGYFYIYAIISNI